MVVCPVRQVKAHGHSADVGVLLFPVLSGDRQHGNVLHLLLAQPVGKPAPVHLHGCLAFAEKGSCRSCVRRVHIVGKGPGQIQLPDQAHRLRPAFRHLSGGFRPRLLLLDIRAGQHSHFSHVMGTVRQRRRQRNDSLFPESADRVHEPRPVCRQIYLIPFKQLCIDKKPLPEGSDRNGVHMPVRFAEKLLLVQPQFRIIPVDLIQWHHPAQDRGGIGARGKKEQHVRLVAGGKIVDDLFFPAFAAFHGIVPDLTARILFKGAQQLGICQAGGIRAREAGSGVQRHPLRSRRDTQRQAKQQNSRQSHSFHALRSFGRFCGIVIRAAVRFISSFSTVIPACP